jgi:hypothetical protein
MQLTPRAHRVADQLINEIEPGHVRLADTASLICDDGDRSDATACDLVQDRVPGERGVLLPRGLVAVLGVEGEPSRYVDVRPWSTNPSRSCPHSKRCRSAVP